jgi:hypothetical protein
MKLRAVLEHQVYALPCWVVAAMLAFALAHGPVNAQTPPAPNCPVELPPGVFLTAGWQDTVIGKAVRLASTRWRAAGVPLDSLRTHQAVATVHTDLLEVMRRDPAWLLALLDRTIQYAAKNPQGNICVKSPGTTMNICRSPAYWRAAVLDLGARSVLAATR